MSNKIRVIASYLPQFYRTPENDLWWGKGFTEWTNVGKAKPLFKNHYQPKVPADLGYYDLRFPETRKAQADMARQFGVEGFCYWHYWFGNGRKLLERPFNEVLKLGEPDFPFCLAWANETWSGIWHGAKNKILIEQFYPGKEDYIKHFYDVLPALLDQRYIKINGKPIFMIYNPFAIPDTKLFINTWQNLAAKNGLHEIYFIAQTTDYRKIDSLLSLEYSAVNIVRLYDIEKLGISKVKRMTKLFFNNNHNLRVYNYSKAMKFFVSHDDSNINIIPTIIPNWDHSPRSGKKAFMLHNSTPEFFKEHVNQVFEIIKLKPKESRIAFIKSWNEWGEGNYLEPDIVHGTKYLEALSHEIHKFQEV